MPGGQASQLPAEQNTSGAPGYPGKKGGTSGIPRSKTRGLRWHPASVKVILLLFSDRENLLLLTLDGHRLHGKQARDAPYAPLVRVACEV